MNRLSAGLLFANLSFHGNRSTDETESSSLGLTSGTENEDNSSQSSPLNLALKNLNLTIQAGEKVAICGRSGR